MPPTPLPFVSVLTPTYNRRIFIPQLLRNFRQQTYPAERMELLVVDDGTDAVGDLLHAIEGVRYIRLPEKQPLGYKRNLLVREARGDILVHMDDDDYYPPDRVAHAVEKLLTGDALLAGSSLMYTYDIFSQSIAQSGPYGPFHGTNGTLAYKREYLRQHRFDDQVTVQDEALFTRDFTSPMIQLDPQSTILCISHSANTINKHDVTHTWTARTLDEFVRDRETLEFYRQDLKKTLNALEIAGAGGHLDLQRLAAEAHRSVQEADLTRAREQYAQLCRLDNDNPDAWMMFGAVSGQLGALSGAVNCLMRAVALRPDFPKAHYNLGNVLRGRGELHEALKCFERAVALDPGYVEAWRASAGVHLMLGGLEQAESCCRRAVELVPASADVRGQLGQVLAEAGKLEEAAEQFSRVTEIAPGLATGWMSLARIHQRMEQYTKAEAAIRRAIVIRTDTPDAHTMLGDVLAAQNRLDEAINCYRCAIALKPDAAHPHYQLGVTLVARGDPGAAVPIFRRVIELKPDFIEAYNRLGLALHEIKQYHDAIDVYQKLLVLQNNSPGIYSNLGNCHFSLGRLLEAEDCLRVAMQHKPDSPECWSNLGGVLTAQGKHDEAIDSYYRALELNPDLFLLQSNLLLCMNYTARYTPKEVFEAHRSWALNSEAKITGQMSHGNPVDPERRLRIGYVSPDLHAHSVSFFIEPILRHHDRTRYEVICYAEVHKPDAVTERLRGYVQGWHNICGLGDAKVVKMIQDDGIDILVDLAGHTGHSRILVFARRPAPVQVTYLGYPNTTGLTAMHYRLTDAWADPPGLTEHYHSETLVRVPGGFLCYQPDAGCPPVAALPAPGIGHVTFGSFNNLTKVTPEVVVLWAKVLHAVPHSRLILKNNALSDEGMRERYYGLFAAQGVERDRLGFMGRQSSLEEHLTIYDRIDIGLDPFPYNGATTTCEALWMGVPVITLAGSAHAGRVGVSLMSQLGLDDCIAEDRDDYVAKAVKLASDLDALAERRAGLRARMQDSALCDGPGFTRKLEESYRGMWRTWCANVRDDGHCV